MFGLRLPWTICALGYFCLHVMACSGTDTASPWVGSIVDSAGIVLVTNPKDGLWVDGDAWVVREDLRIGSFSGDPNYQFGQVGEIVLNSAGHILVMDRQARELREFTEGGAFVRSMGSPGEGPGEFGLGVADVFVDAGDTLLVPDVRNRRIHRISPDGTFLPSAVLDLSLRRPLRFRWAPLTRRAVVQLRPSSVETNPETGGVTDELRLIEPDGSFGELLLSFPAGGLLGPNVVRYFTPEPSWALTDSLSVLYGVNSEYRIGSYGRDGSLLRVVIKPHEPRPISDRDIRAFFAYLDRAWLAAGVPPSRLQQNHQRVSFADHFPAFSTIHVGYQGSIWVQPVRAPGDMSDSDLERYNFIEDFGASDWDVFDVDGRFLGKVNMPPRFQPRLFVGDAIYGVARDEFDVQYVVRLRVETGPAG